MAKPTTIKIRLNSTADTGHFYVTKKNARTNHGVKNPSNMFVLESYVGRAFYHRQVNIHGRGYHGVKTRYVCNGVCVCACARALVCDECLWR